MEVAQGKIKETRCASQPLSSLAQRSVLSVDKRRKVTGGGGRFGLWPCRGHDRGPASHFFANTVIFQRIGKELIKVEVIVAVRSYNRRHASDSEGFDDKADGGPAGVVLRLPGVGQPRSLRGQFVAGAGEDGAAALLVHRRVLQPGAGRLRPAFHQRRAAAGGDLARGRSLSLGLCRAVPERAGGAPVPSAHLPFLPAARWPHPDGRTDHAEGHRLRWRLASARAARLPHPATALPAPGLRDLADPPGQRRVRGPQQGRQLCHRLWRRHYPGAIPLDRPQQRQAAGQGL